MVTKKAIADYLGISRTAVSLVLNNTPNSTVSTETRDKILKASRELGYRELEVNPKLCFILYNREANDPRYMGDLHIIEEAASKNGYGLMFTNITDQPESLTKLQKLLDSHEIDGFILTGDVDEQLIDRFNESGARYICRFLCQYDHSVWCLAAPKGIWRSRAAGDQPDCLRLVRTGEDQHPALNNNSCVCC